MPPLSGERERTLSPAVLNYIMDSEVPKPCRHFLGRENELEKLHAILEENSKIFLYGIAGIGKSELAKAYAKIYSKEYTNILYLMYSGDLRQDIIDLDFADDLPEDTEENRFRKHNRFLRTLKEDTLLIIDNFNTTATKDSFGQYDEKRVTIVDDICATAKGYEYLAFSSLRRKG